MELLYANLFKSLTIIKLLLPTIDFMVILGR